MRGLKTSPAPVRFFFGYQGWQCWCDFVVIVQWVFTRLLVSLNELSRELKGDETPEKSDDRQRSQNKMGELLIILGAFAVWFLVQIYILPKMGVST